MNTVEDLIEFFNGSNQSSFFAGRINPQLNRCGAAFEVFEATDFPGQARQAFKNILAILAEANAGPEHITRITWYVNDKQEYLGALKEVGQAYRDTIGRHYPAMALIEVKGFVEDGAKLEIETTAVVPD